MSEDIVRMNEDIFHFSGPDQSDKEMFDAQLISGLKDRVKELEDLLKRSLPFIRVWSLVHEIEALLPKEKQDD